jgi:hypothetical protein
MSGEGRSPQEDMRKGLVRIIGHREVLGDRGRVSKAAAIREVQKVASSDPQSSYHIILTVWEKMTRILNK